MNSSSVIKEAAGSNAVAKSNRSFKCLLLLVCPRHYNANQALPEGENKKLDQCQTKTQTLDAQSQQAHEQEVQK